ncbi:hypothetical protein BC834DRAFT_855279 [Gloeopeniophorella convolvens]|nr:hypothetical protein BC834DRAFT_855279 [Gloeopeniophorella convolvens]
MTTTAPGPGSPLKGKSKDDAPSSSHWWDFYALVEQQGRPVVWASSAILCAHESEPIVVGRTFPSSQQFILPSPAAVAAAPGSYEPPTVLTLSPDESWLFAYFPGRQQPGVGCIWRAHHADSWVVVEPIGFSRNGGVVSAAWLGHVREWAIDSSRRTSRLPPLGPAMLVASPALVLVTQNMQFQVCNIRFNATLPKVTSISCSLGKHDGSSAVPNSDPLPDLENRLCTHAAIGLGYDETSILVATRSHTKVVPLEPSYVPLGSDLRPDLASHLHNVHLADSADWESWAQESNIELAEIRQMGDAVYVRPLPPIRCVDQKLSSLSFFPAHQETVSTEQVPTTPILRMYLCASLVNFGDYSALPTSELTIYGLSRKFYPNTASEWLSTKLVSKIFPENVTFVVPHHRFSHSGTVVVGSWSAHTPHTKRNLSAKVPSGTVSVLRLPSLDPHPDWETEPLLTARGDTAPPFYVALSPNGALFCSIPPLMVTPSRVLVHAMPKRTLLNATPPQDQPAPDFILALISAINSKRSVSDITHQLSSNSISVQEVEGVLYEVISSLQSQRDGLRDVWLHEFLGVALEVYRAKGERTPKALEKDDLASRWRTIQDLCSIVACQSAFEDCTDGDAVELDTVWPLTVLSTWYLNFIEELMRECVLLGDAREGLGDNATERQAIPTPHPVLLSLLHTDVLSRIRKTLGTVKRFYEHLSSLSPGGENGALSRSLLLDAVDGSGINLEALDALLVQISEKVGQLDASDALRSLAACRPVPAVYPFLFATARLVSHSNAIDKPRLFIKPLDFISEVGKARRSSEAVDEGQDVISKGVLLRQRPTRACIRCGGKTQQNETIVRSDSIVPRALSLQWQTWGRRWSARCICGGRWISLSRHT